MTERLGGEAIAATEQTAARLRSAVLALRAPTVAKRAPAPTSSVFGRAAAAVPLDAHQPATRGALNGRFGSVETSALMSGTSMVLVVLPDAGAPSSSLQRTCDLLVRAGAVVLILGPDMPRDVPADRSRPLAVPLRKDDALSQEWAMIACGPARRIAFLARRETSAEDLWSWIITRDPIAVHRAGTAILERVPFLKLRVPPLAA
ncbi:MAG: hypothetical protein ABIO67_01305 [Mycobacteriales bacterium]